MIGGVKYYVLNIFKTKITEDYSKPNRVEYMFEVENKLQKPKKKKQPEYHIIENARAIRTIRIF